MSQGANHFRVRAYRRAAATVDRLETPLAELLASRGRSGLVALPAIGAGIAAAIAEMIHTGHWSLLDRLRGAADPERVLQTIPGIGPKLARRIHESLDVESLEALEVAAYDGRLERLPGIGTSRAAAIRADLAYRLERRPDRSRTLDRHAPAVSTLLDIDRRYREAAADGSLPLITPRRFNPENRAWLPVGHFHRDGWHFTALFSNTARAHQLGRTHDWVVIYFYDNDHREGLNTVVTETEGPLSGRRVVRGREAECRALAASPPRPSGGDE